jgi:hypothetical protein
MASRDKDAVEAAGDYVIESGVYTGLPVRHLDKAGLERIAKVGAGKRGSAACREAKAWASLWAARTDTAAHPPPTVRCELAQLVMTAPSTKTKTPKTASPGSAPWLQQVRSLSAQPCRGMFWLKLGALCLLPCLVWPKLARVPVRASAMVWSSALRRGGRLAGMVLEEYWSSSTILYRELWQLVDYQLDAWLGIDPPPQFWEPAGTDPDPDDSVVTPPYTAQPLAASSPNQPSARGLSRLLDRAQALGQAFLAGLGAALSLLVCGLANLNTQT